MEDGVIIISFEQLATIRDKEPGRFARLVADRVLKWEAIYSGRGVFCGWEMPEEYLTWKNAGDDLMPSHRTASDRHIDQFSPATKVESDHEVLEWCQIRATFKGERYLPDGWQEATDDLYFDAKRNVAPYQVGDWSMIALMVFARADRKE